MKDWIIKNIKSGVSDGGIACGPIGGAAMAQVELSDEEGKTTYMYIASVEGYPCFSNSDEDLFEEMLREEYDDYEEIELLEYEGVELSDYYEIYDQLENTKEDEHILIKLLLHIIHAVDYEEEYEKDKLVGKKLSELRFKLVEFDEDDDNFNVELA